MQRVKVEVEPTRSGLATLMLISKTTPRARVVVGYGIKIFVPRPLHYVTRSPGLWLSCITCTKENFTHSIEGKSSIAVNVLRPLITALDVSCIFLR